MPLNQFQITNRKKMLVAMEYIARQTNDEGVFNKWLMCGVPDGDIQFGNFDISQIDDEDSMLEDKNFSELMKCFLNVMTAANENGGLYCGGVKSSQSD